MIHTENPGIDWDDLRVSATMVEVRGAQYSRPPEFVQILNNKERGPSFSGLYAYRFGYGRRVFQSGHFQAQLPHGYKEGTDIEPHIHVRLDPVSGAEAGQKLLLEFEYVWVNVSETRPQSSRILSMNYEISDADLKEDNVLISFGLISKSDAVVSSMLDCRFSRLSFDPNWGVDYWSPNGVDNDSFQGHLILKEFDFHYQKDSPGSREQYKK